MAIVRGVWVACLIGLVTASGAVADEPPVAPPPNVTPATQAPVPAPSPPAQPAVASPAIAPPAPGAIAPPPGPPASEAKPANPPPPNTIVLHKPVNVLGQNVTTADGKATGRIVDLLVNQAGQPRAAVIDFGGFMGLGTRRVAVDWTKMHFAPANKTAATVDLTVSQLEAAPEYTDTSGPVAVANPPPLHPPPALDVPPVVAPLSTPAPPAALPLGEPAPSGATP